MCRDLIFKITYCMLKWNLVWNIIQDMLPLVWGYIESKFKNIFLLSITACMNLILNVMIGSSMINIHIQKYRFKIETMIRKTTCCVVIYEIQSNTFCKSVIRYGTKNNTRSIFLIWKCYSERRKNWLKHTWICHKVYNKLTHINFKEGNKTHYQVILSREKITQ